MTNDEARMTKEVRMTKGERTTNRGRRILSPTVRRTDQQVGKRICLPQTRSYLFRCSLASFGILLLTGCGQQDYQQRLDKSLVAVKHQAKFGILELQPTTLPGTPVSMRLPAKLDARLTLESQDPEGSGTVAEARIQAGKVTLPGLRMTCQGLEKDERGVEVPYFCHLAAVARDPTSPPLLDKLHEQVKAAFPEAGAFEEVTCESLVVGQTIAWQRLEAKGEDSFQRFGVTTSDVLPGAFSYWVHEGEAWQVIVVWRVPDSIEMRVPAAEWARRMCGTLAIGS
jgi:hypothetical protein